jgi:hypothetical protein
MRTFSIRPHSKMTSQPKIIFMIILMVGALGASSSEPSRGGDTSKAASIAPQVTDDPIFLFYAANLRASLFSGFLTLGSFLVAVNTFMIVNLKKEVYEHKLYKIRVHDARREYPKATFFGPLRNLSRLIFSTIVLAMTTSVSQLTIGVLWRTWISVSLCLVLAVVTIIFLSFALFYIHVNLKDWFTFLEKVADEEYESETRKPPT